MSRLSVLAKRFSGLLCATVFSVSAFADYPAGSPVAINGKLSVNGTQLVNECGNPVQLRGMSSHGPQWFGNCICEESLNLMVNEWGINIFRIAMYEHGGENVKGYLSNPSYWSQWIDDRVNECEKLGIYCIVDWHVLNPGNPKDNIEGAKTFWKETTEKYKNKKHVLYEICNEPNGCQWSDVKEYAEVIIPIIRNNNDETVTIVGTTMWSQDVDIASQNKLDFTNVMYTLHFYSGTHGQELMNKAETALRNGAAIFITEFGTSDANGNNNFSEAATRNWIQWANNKKISWANWSYSDKGETSAALVPGSCNSKNWNNLTDSGKLIKELITKDPFTFTACNGQQQENNNNQGNNNQQNNQENNNNQQNNQGNNNNQQNNQENNNNNQQQQNVTYPELTTNITVGHGYRIVNKATGKVMSSNNKMEGDAPLVTVTRKEGDNSQIYIFKGADEFFRLKNDGSGKYLTNKYQPNDGTDIVQIDYNQYDESEKWKITAVEGKWFRIENTTTHNNSSCIASTGSNDGDAVKQYTWSNQDNQLWGLEATEYDDSGIESFSAESFLFYPTIWGDEFFIEGYGFDQVLVCNLSGVIVKHFSKADSYNVSDLATGTYFVVLKEGNSIIGRFRAIKR